MNRKILGFVLSAMFLALCVLGEAQEPKIHKIGYLSGSSVSAAAPRIEAFRQGLRELGYVEGRNIGIEYRYAEGNLDRVSDQVAELIRLKVDVIVSGNEASIRAAQQATKTVPIIVAATGDPVASGFVASLERPGGNITGTTTFGSETLRKRVELLKETVPQLSQLAVLWNPGNLTQKQRIKEIDGAAKAFEVKLQLVELPRPDALDNALSALTKERPNGLYIFRSPIVTMHTKGITEFAAKNRLPTMHEDNRFVEAGGLMSYGPDLSDLDRRTAVFVDKILKGAKPADLPVEGPKKFELFINLRTAQQIGLTIPQQVLNRADKVIR